MKHAGCLLVAFVCLGAFASDPGQPLDCSDWVSDIPGYTCENLINNYQTRGSDLAIDNQGFRLYITGNLVLTRQDPVTAEQQIVGHIVTGRPGPNNSRDDIHGTPGCEVNHNFGYFVCYPPSLTQVNVVSFDPVGGTLSIPVVSECVGNCDPPYPYSLHTLRIHGFAPLLEIFQSYVPQPAAIAFTVPAMPEGMAGADSFDTYWGPLAKPIDFTQAHGLQCNYPSTAPHIGDYLSVPDTVTTPAPGQGVYYVTSATYQGATRYGRKTNAGHLSGRDPALLPACTTP